MKRKKKLGRIKEKEKEKTQLQKCKSNVNTLVIGFSAFPMSSLCLNNSNPELILLLFPDIMDREGLIIRVAVNYCATNEIEFICKKL